MKIGDFLGIHPSELKFPFKLRKQSSCSLQLANKTDHYIAFKVKTTNPKRYSVRPNAGVILPHSLCNVTVTKQAPKETPLDMVCRDKFMVQSVIAPDGMTSKDLANKLFDKEDGKVVEEFRLRVIYVPASRPPTVPEEDEEGLSPETSSAEDEIKLPSKTAAAIESVHSQTFESQRRSLISKLKQEKASIQEQNEKLLQELELLQEWSRRRRVSALILFEILALIASGVWIGYFIRHSCSAA